MSSVEVRFADPYFSYANSVLQALYFCSPFRELLFQYPDPSLTSPHKSVSASTSIPTPSPTTSHGRRKPERKPTADSLPSNGTAHPPGPSIPSSPDTLFSALRSLFLHISKNPADKGTIAPRAFIEKLKDVNTEFRNTNHQDAHEFLIFLLNKIVEEIEEERKHQRVATMSREDCEYHSTGLHIPFQSRSNYLQCLIPLERWSPLRSQPRQRARIPERRPKMLLWCINFSKVC